MKVKRINKRFTFVIIPDANSAVRRFEVPKALLYCAGAGLIALLSVTLVLYVNHARTSWVTADLQSRIVSQEAVYSTTVQEKNDTIEQLQNELIQLSQQTVEMKGRIDDIRKLEDEVRTITGAAKSTASAASSSVDSNAMGGSNRPVTDEEIKTLLEQTKQHLSSMNQEVAELQGSITDTKAKAVQAQELLRITPNIWPVDSRNITSGFGIRKDPFTYRPSFHSGYDIAAPMNTPVRVTADGIVSSTGSDSSHGNNIVVTHSKGLQTWYMHLNKINVKQGERVQKGDVIGLVGSTGRSTGAHLHYEVLKNGQSTDPKPYLN
ncbi:M23 family metallopeptidase [Paenibacillus sp. NPDC056579]|uniref:M23 family metallopeptidase n=1 Tax=unclassified Paenibacillus TaxID=185978 RepID=UPI001EF7AE48|nr:M23 family metallopeptidase [Paenibacillus sp. H1-7]